MIALLVKASLVIVVLLAFYKLFLEKESFYLANRIYLLSCLVLASTLPFMALPALVAHQGVLSTLIETSGEKEPILREEAMLSGNDLTRAPKKTAQSLDRSSGVASSETKPGPATEGMLLMGISW